MTSLLSRCLSGLVLFSSALLAAPAKVGDKAPVASALTHEGVELNLAEVYAKNLYTLVYFYPKADTSGCTKQSCSLRDAFEDLTNKGVAVIGVSTDSVDDQRAFKEKHKLPFTLLADRERKVIQAFGVPLIPIAGLAQRQAYLIKDGHIIWADHKASTDEQAQDVLKVLK